MERKRSWLTRRQAAIAEMAASGDLSSSSRRQGAQIGRLPGLQVHRRVLSGAHRDLPRAAADVPAKFKSEPWARLGVNVDADFEPLYIISPEKKSTVTELRGLLKDVDELYLATDGDREAKPSPGICWKP